MTFFVIWRRATRIPVKVIRKGETRDGLSRGVSYQAGSAHGVVLPKGLPIDMVSTLYRSFRQELQVLIQGPDDLMQS